MTEDTRPPTLTIGLPNFGSWFRSPGDLVEAAAELDRVGVDRISVVDHLVMGRNTDAYAWGTFPTGPKAPWYEPLTMLTAVAAVTSRIRLSTAILVAPVRPAAVLAKTVATLDALSGGRVDLGVGTGWQREEFDALGLDFDRRGRLLDEVLGGCRALWEETPARFISESTSFDDIWCVPGPVQDRLPVWFAGTLGARNLRRIVELGDGWIPIMGATFDDVRRDAERLRGAWDAAGRQGEPAVTVRLPPVRSGDALDVDATVAQVPAAVAAGATDVSIAAQSLASPGDTGTLVRRATELLAGIRGGVDR